MESQSMEYKRKPNRLASEPSPYLRQHAYNPVDWRPWGQEAFDLALKQDKPIFLSIGYSTCHWCHVMERESFENELIADLMNKTFVNIKVDREERPDVDSVYMQVCQMLTGSGGWPLTIIMTPDKKPFFAGTYFPPTSRFGRHGVKELAEKIGNIWQNNRQMLIKSSEDITSRVISSAKSINTKSITPEIFKMAERELDFAFDKHNGGFGNAPKFPIPHHLSFLLRFWKKENSPSALNMALFTLNKMRNGGIFDQIGFGFHRYSTDAKWLAPHFEKMLYDQAQLLYVYSEAYSATKNELYKKTALEIVEYTFANLRAPKGAFYCAEDADSEGVEGKFYVWNRDEFESAAQDADFAPKAFGVTTKGNFFESVISEDGINILTANKTSDELADEFDLSFEESKHRLENIRLKLLTARSKRIKPHLDDKVLTDWNSLMIGALAYSARTLDSKELAKAAKDALSFIFMNLFDNDGRLLHRWHSGVSGIDAMLDDYAFLVNALLETYQTTFEVEYLKKAIALTDTQIQEFWDNKHYGFFSTSSKAEKLLVRNKEYYDGAIPSGNSVSLGNLLLLYKLTGVPTYQDYAAKLIESFAGYALRSPSSYTCFLCSLNMALGATAEIVIVGESDSADAIELLRAVNAIYQPNKAVIFKSEESVRQGLEIIAPFTKHLAKQKGRATVYVCKNHSCDLPVTDKEELINKLKRL